MIKVIIADDQEMIRQSLEIVINSKSDMEVIGIAGNGQEAYQKVRESRPDVLLLDIRMPVMNGVECIKKIKEKGIETKIIILTTFDDDEYIFDALKNGASGYLLKGIGLEEMIKAIRTVANGGTLINPTVATKLMKLFSNMAKADYTFKTDDATLDELNSSEMSIIKQLGRGLSNKEISEELGISEGTIRNYISSILSKLDLKNRTQLAIYAVQTGMATGLEIE